MPVPTPAEPVLGVLAEEWAALGALCADLDEAAWKAPTALPGWTVQDCISHVVGTERMLMGEPAPDVAVGHLAHLAPGDDLNAVLETWVEARRGRPGAEVLAELGEVAERRLAQLAELPPGAWDVVGWSPVGQVPLRDFMAVRVFDCWMHEQDVRRALGRPGHLTGPVVDVALVRLRAGLGFVVGKRAGAPVGSSVVLDLTGGPVDALAVVVEARPSGGERRPSGGEREGRPSGGERGVRASVVDAVPDEPTARIALGFEAFVALFGGRADPAAALAAGQVTVAGDAELGRRVVAALPVTP